MDFSIGGSITFCVLLETLTKIQELNDAFFFFFPGMHTKCTQTILHLKIIFSLQATEVSLPQGTSEHISLQRSGYASQHLEHRISNTQAYVRDAMIYSQYVRNLSTALNGCIKNSLSLSIRFCRLGRRNQSWLQDQNGLLPLQEERFQLPKQDTITWHAKSVYRKSNWKASHGRDL